MTILKFEIEIFISLRPNAEIQKINLTGIIMPTEGDIGICVCNKFFDLNKSFYISGKVSKSRWLICVCPSVCLSENFEASSLSIFNGISYFISHDAHQHILQNNGVICSNFILEFKKK